MSSGFRASLLAIATLALSLSACDREERHSRAKPLGENVPAGPSPGVLHAGAAPANGQPDPRAAMYLNDARPLPKASGCSPG